MDEQHDRYAEDEADDLLRRALIDAEASVAVALRVEGLAMAEAVTVIFHGRRDLGTIQTYVANGGAGAGAAVAAAELLRVPCDLDLGRRREIATRPRSSTRAGRARSATRSSRRTPSWPSGGRARAMGGGGRGPSRRH